MNVTKLARVKHKEIEHSIKLPVSLFIKEEAQRLGFAECRMSRAEFLNEDSARLRRWLEAGMHGQMGYMARNVEKRTDPALLVDNARTVVSVAVNYFPKEKQNPELPQIAKYAYGKDYHTVVKDMLHCLLQRIRDRYGNVSGRAFVDSAPVPEHAWAARSGIGWTGKHSLTIHPQYGSYIFLGELIIDLAAEPDPPIADRCGTCTRCIDACPVQAIVAPYTVDARRCLSYLTVEYKGDFDPSVHLHHRMFGCDICQDACPWNKRAQPTAIGDFEPNTAILNKTAEDWRRSAKEEFDALTRDSPLQRAGYEAAVRNAGACNTNDNQAAAKI